MHRPLAHTHTQPASGKSLKVTAANFGSAAKQLFTCVAYTKKGTCIVGAKDGSVYAFGDQTCKKVFPGVHQSVVRRCDLRWLVESELECADLDANSKMAVLFCILLQVSLFVHPHLVYSL